MATATVERAFYSPTEYAQATGISLSSVWAAIRNQEIASTRLGGRRLIPVSEIERLRGAALASTRPGHNPSR
jgi:excisionase family DNA binding protein